ncbi:hypothetical protein EB796_018339 [Bugula neritina]|uniref:Uncharacterized protein n=1 Tax=Bugula neritina TaxID=10212 RepID=A0A7J7JBA5_BUGNE|nr:hypothetical protein EB796_018339 [Bugula neritina]
MISFYQNMTFLVLDVKLRRLRYISLQKERHPKLFQLRHNSSSDDPKTSTPDKVLLVRYVAMLPAECLVLV